MEGTSSLANWFHKHVSNEYYEFIVALGKRCDESGILEISNTLDLIPTKRAKPKKKKKKKLKKSQKYTNKNFRRYKHN